MQNRIDSPFLSDIARFDRPEILSRAFHPRPEVPSQTTETDWTDVLIAVDEQVEIGARLYHADFQAPTMLFFHGNGEIVADYDERAREHTALGINFLPVDYRGYGRSSGEPSFTAMMSDCHRILAYIRAYLAERGYTGSLVVMGRSLGSAPALELAARHQDMVDGLILDSAFALLVPLLRVLGIDPEQFDLSEKNGMWNLKNIRTFHKPVLIIHAEYDHLIPFYEAYTLLDASPSHDKRLFRVSGADHNTIFLYGGERYLVTVKQFMEGLRL